MWSPGIQHYISCQSWSSQFKKVIIYFVFNILSNCNSEMGTFYRLRLEMIYKSEDFEHLVTWMYFINPCELCLIFVPKIKSWFSESDYIDDTFNYEILKQWYCRALSVWFHFAFSDFSLIAFLNKLTVPRE